MPLPEEVVTSVASTNFKSLGDGPSFYHNLAMSNATNQQNLAAQNAIAQQQALGTVLTAAVGKIVKALTEADAEEAASLNKVFSGDDVASKIASLLSALGSGQVAAKTAQTTPPPTGG
ncbi:MAG: RebB family R body protein [Planctomycetes bacterium]|nr:RebB family R body protein [Planctomycetota bacterium]HMQ16779.1 RebB family R body protein [Phycisphaerae bacterium]